MPDLAQSLMFTWQIAASEAVKTKVQFIEKEHIFIALCKVSDLLQPEILNQIGSGLDKERLVLELNQLERLFTQNSISRKKLRRRLRGIVGEGDVHQAENVIHRSQDCKQYFEKALQLAQHDKFKGINVFHLLVAIMEKPGEHITAALSDCGINKQDFLTAARSVHKNLPESIPPGKGAPGHGQQAATPYLDKYGRDLTQLAREGKLGVIVERRDETLAVIRILVRSTKNNPVLIGEPGVGKTALVEGLAQRIARGNLTELLQNKRIIELHMSSVVAGTKYRGEFEERLQTIIAEATANPDIILFIDEIHTVIGSGSAEGMAMDGADIMKPALGRGSITCIGATTIEEYRKYFEKDAALERRFEPIILEEPSAADSIKILQQVMAKRKDVYIDPQAIRAAVELSIQYMPYRRLPDKAIDVLEDACARIKVPALSFYGGDNAETLSRKVVTAEIIAEVVAKRAGVPVKRLPEEEKEHYLQMENILKKRIIGQDEAITKVSASIRMHITGLKDSRRPIGVFLFLGPTGVGKTELAKALSEFLFGTEAAIIRLDMSEFMEKHSVAKLIGAPPGYVGHEEGGQFTGRLRNKPYAVVLLDEIEKAHPDIFDLFLQVFDEGRLTDAKGRTVDAKNVLFIMTSNIGTEFYYKEPIGFIDPSSENGKTIKNDIQLKIRQTFRLEFLNRIDKIIFFNPLSQDNILLIARNMLAELKDQVSKDKGIQLQIEDAAVTFVGRAGYDPMNGARPLKRAIEQIISSPLTKLILQGEFVEGDGVLVDEREENIIFQKQDISDETE